MRLFLLSLFYMLSMASFSQDSAHVIVKLYDSRKVPIINVNVTLSSSSGVVLFRNFSDVNGSTEFLMPLDSSKYYEVSYEKRNYTSENFHFKPEIIDGKITTLIIETTMLRLCCLGCNPLPVYKDNSTISLTTFDDSDFKELLSEYPEMKLTIYYVPGLTEKKSVARKRMAEMKRFFNKHDYNLNRLVFKLESKRKTTSLFGQFEAQVTSI